MPKLDLASLRGKAGSVFDGFTRGQKTVLAIAVAAVLAGGFLFLKWSSAPSYTALFSNLSAEDAGEVTSKLTSQGVSYQLADGGSTVLVPRADVYQLRLDLSADGLPSTGNPGYALLDRQGITTSEFRQRVDYQRALEGELSNTIGAISGVSSATVHLVIPKEDLFSRDASKPTASVLIQQSGGQGLSSGQVQGVVHLVASSVEGLEPAEVTVTDGSGRVLSSGDDGGLAAGDARTEQTANFENLLSGSIEELLAPVVGEGKAVVQVRAALDFDQRSSTSERFGAEDRDPVTVTESTATEDYTGGDPNAAGGVLGPDGARIPAADGSEYGKESAQRTFAVDKVTEQVQTAPGKLTRLSVAVLLDNGANVDLNEVEDLVAAAAGIDPDRGDAVKVTSMRFDDSAAEAAKKALEEEKATEQRNQLLGMVRTGGAVVLVLAILLLAFRSARKATVSRTPVALPALGLPHPEGSIVPAPIAAEMHEPVALQAAPAPPLSAPKELVPRNLVEMIDNQPDDVAHMLRGWLAER